MSGGAGRKMSVLVAMCFAMLLGYIPWYSFSAVLKYIASDLSLGPSDTGHILAAFQAGYVAIVPVSGWLADRVGLKRLIFWATFFTGSSSVLFALAANGKWSTLLLRLATGLSAGAIYVPGLALLSRWFPPTSRSAAFGAYTAALTAAYAAGYFVAGPVAAVNGWRTAILWTSVPVFIGAIVVAFFVSEPAQEELVGPGVEELSVPHPKGKPDNVGSGAPSAPFPSLLAPLLVTLAYIGHMWEQYAFWGWLGPFLVASATASGMETARAVSWGGTAAAMIILLGAPATLVWGIMTDRRGVVWGIIVASMASLLAEFVVGFLFGQPLWVVLTVSGWIGFWVVADSAVFKAGLSAMVSTGRRGTYLGIQSAVGFGATIVAPLAFGWTLERLNGRVDPAAARVWGPPFVVLGLGALMAPLSALALRLVQARPNR